MVESTSATGDPAADDWQIAQTPVPDTSALPDTHRGPLHTEQGKTSVTEQVVQKVAGMACREVPGVYAMGSNTRRMLNNITERIPRSQTNVTSGVSVQKGERQTAIDLSIVLEYGYSVVEVAGKIRQNVIAAVEYATGLEVVQVNIEVTDVKLPGDDDPRADDAPAASLPELA